MRRFRLPYWQFLVLPALLYAVGFALNAVAMAANHAQMPVLMPGGQCNLLNSWDMLHGCMASGAHLKFLCDWIVIRDFGIASPGDFLMWAGAKTFFPALYMWLALAIKKLQELPR